MDRTCFWFVLGRHGRQGPDDLFIREAPCRYIQACTGTCGDSLIDGVANVLIHRGEIRDTLHVLSRLSGLDWNPLADVIVSDSHTSAANLTGRIDGRG